MNPQSPISVIRRHLRELEKSLTFQAHELARRDTLRDLLEITIGAPADQKAVLDFALWYAIEDGELAESGSIFMKTPAGAGQALRFLLKRVVRAEGGIEQSTTADQFETFQENEGLAGYVLTSGEPICSNNPAEDPRYVRFTTLPQLKSIICVPVKLGTFVLAVISIHNRQRDLQFRADDLAFVEDLARISALCIRAYHHDLTMLPSRPLMDELLKREIEAASKLGKPLCLAYLDIDRFSDLNHKFEHDGADQVLQRMAAVVRQHLSGAAILCHRHGDEFGIILPDHSAEQAVATAERVREEVEKADYEIELPDGKKAVAKITTSIGIAQWKQPMDYKQLLAQADQANKDAKGEPGGTGRNRVMLLK